MNDRDAARIRLHDDTPLFREAIAFTAAKTGFNGQVIEKDYFCTVLLEDLALNGGKDLFFKGGTCLAKVHAGFYRLSEDLDFAIPLHVDANRAERSRAANAIKRAVADVSARLPCFSCQTELKGANDSTQYSGVVTYRSVVSGQPETVLIDVSVREPALIARLYSLPVRSCWIRSVEGPPSPTSTSSPSRPWKQWRRNSVPRFRDGTSRSVTSSTSTMRRGTYPWTFPSLHSWTWCVASSRFRIIRQSMSVRRG